jgi:hypothetical protein
MPRKTCPPCAFWNLAKTLVDLEALEVTVHRNGGKDQLPFHSVGLPGFLFIQNELKYSSPTGRMNIEGNGCRQGSLANQWMDSI